MSASRILMAVMSSTEAFHYYKTGEKGWMWFWIGIGIANCALAIWSFLDC